MRIVLISAGAPASTEYRPPLGLTYIISYLKAHGFPDVCFLDRDRVSENEMAAALKEAQPEWVGISCITPLRHEAFGIARLAKEVVPGVSVVLGGIHASYLSRQILEHYRQIDYVVRGEGEQTMLELAQCLQGGGDPGAVAGLSFRRGGEVVEVPDRPLFADLDCLPFPEYVEHFSPTLGEGRKCAVMTTSRGCGSACTYCAVSNFWGRARFRSPANVVDEMEQLVTEHGVGYIELVDDAFSIDMERAAAICREILRRGLDFRWKCSTRVDRVSLELLRLMRQAGCVRLSYGIESGSPAILKSICKMVTLDQIVSACRWAHEAGLRLSTCFMVGNAGETQETIDQTKALIRQIQPDEFSISQCVYLFPGTAVYRKAVRQGLMDDRFWLSEEPVFAYTAENSLEQMARWQMELLQECSASMGWMRFIKYALAIARRMSPGAVVRAGLTFLRVRWGARKAKGRSAAGRLR
jgi:radical SAM superfamily enzyme YgiQ (UPF0313 family)